MIRNPMVSKWKNRNCQNSLETFENTLFFRADIKHAVETRCSKRDTITLLCTCLKENPLQLIKGIGSLYTRFVSDTIPQDIFKFKAPQDGA